MKSSTGNYAPFTEALPLKACVINLEYSDGYHHMTNVEERLVLWLIDTMIADQDMFAISFVRANDVSETDRL